MREALGRLLPFPQQLFKLLRFFFFFHTSAKLQLPRKSEPPYFCSIPIICPSVRHGKKGLLSATGYLSPRVTLGASKIRSQGHVEQRGIRQLNISFFFEVISLIRRQGSLWDGFDFSSLWSVAVFSTHKLKSILPILSDLHGQIWSQG